MKQKKSHSIMDSISESDDLVQALQAVKQPPATTTAVHPSTTTLIPAPVAAPPPLPTVNVTELNKQLVQAIEKSDFSKIQQLIKAGADPQSEVCVRDTSRVSEYTHPLHVAAQKQNVTILAYLLETCKVDFFNSTVRNVQDGRHHVRIHEYDAFCAAISSCKEQSILNYLVRFVKQAGKINARGANYEYSSDRGDKPEVFYNMTYLHYAVWRKNPVAMEVLIRHGANPHLRCNANRYHYSDNDKYNGPTPLQMYPELQQIILKCATFGNKFHAYYNDIVFVLQ